jgi:signal transduction histidine kinase
VVSRAILDAAGELTEYVGAVRDITEQKRAERALRRARVRGLEARYAAMMEERTRMAREIHDTVLQGFNGVALLLLAAAGKVESPPEAVAGLQHVLDLAEATLGDARRAIWDLRAPTPASDFTATVRMAAEESVRGTGLSLEFVMRGRARTLDPRSEAVALRIVQEAIANVRKHAEAQRVRVRLSYGRRSVRVSVRDDGRGFTVDPDFHAYGGHWGLLGMWERASQVNGRVEVRSGPGAGTEVVLRLG